MGETRQAPDRLASGAPAGWSWGVAPVAPHIRAVVTVGILLLWAGWAALAIRQGTRATADSAAYVECAKSIVSGDGFAIRPFNGLDAPRWEPLREWPPGYPLLIAACMTLGLSAPTAALAAAVVSCGAFIVLVVNLCLTRFPLPVAVLLSLIIVTMPALVKAGTMCWSDVSCLALAAASLACLVKASRGGSRSPLWFLASGAAAGLALCVRNAAIPLLLASALVQAAGSIRTPLRLAARNGLLYLTGCASACGWLVVRNLVAFGRISPYGMSASHPSDRPLLINVRDALSVILGDMTNSPRLRDAVSEAPPLLAAAGLLVGVALLGLWGLCALLRARQWNQAGREATLYTCYAIFYVATVVAARTVYQWGENVNSRHFIQIYWLLWIGLGAAAWRWLHWNRAARLAAYGALVCVLAFQTRAAWNYLYVRRAGGSRAVDQRRSVAVA